MPALDIQAIREILPHRFPMLLVDRIEELEEDRVVGIKNVTANEPFFVGHFPDFPVMPGVLIVEAMAQASALFSFTDENGGLKCDSSKTAYYLVGVDGARFRRPVVPGDQLRIEVEAERLSRSICKYQARATVDGQEVASAKLMCAIRSLEE
jgi:3-hydroxyacyl-[acyl-carrier-protein] dehydratase